MLIDPDTDGPVRVLSLDGGGVRGLLNAVLIAELERALDAPMQQHFDVIAGTSTGALIAAGLAAPPRNARPLDAGVFVDIDRQRAGDIFPKRRTLPRAILSAGARPRRSEPLDDVLTTYVRDVRLAETAVEVAIPAYDVLEREPVLFTRAAAREAGDTEFRLADAALASAAAPSYLPSVEASWLGRPRRFIDGGVFANDPALLTLLALRRVDDRRPVRVLSLGTGLGSLKHGYRSGTAAARPRDPRNAELLFMGALEAVLDANGRMASDAVRQLLGPDDHLRIDYDFPEGVPDLDDARLETLDQLSRQALATWHRRRGAIVDWVTGAR